MISVPIRKGIITRALRPSFSALLRPGRWGNSNPSSLRFASTSAAAITPTANNTSQLPPKRQATNVIFVIGPPGAGKGTQCERLAKDFGFMHISAGELLRKERSTGSDMAKEINTYLSAGQIVPVRISLSLMQRAIESAAPETVVVDGYPRNFDNVQGWESNMPADKFSVRAVISIDCDASELLSRILERGRTSGRDDDTASQFALRMRTHEAASVPVLPYYEQRRLLFRVDGSRSVDEVYSDLKQVVERVLCSNDSYLK